MSGRGFLEHSLPEAISASLAGLRSLTVRSSLLAARLAEANPDPRQIAREADVDMVLAGTILCEGDQVASQRGIDPRTLRHAGGVLCLHHQAATT